MASSVDLASSGAAPDLRAGRTVLGLNLSTRRTCLILALFAYALAAWLHWGWLRHYRILDLPPRWDEAAYHTRAVWFAESMRSGGSEDFWSAFADPGEPRPPLLSLSTLPLSALGPYQVWFGHAVILAYLGLLVVSVFFIGEHIGSPSTGLFACIYLLAFPSTLVYSRVFLSDLPAAALVSLAILCMLKSAHYTRVSWNIALGGSIGLAMNVRNFAGVYLFLPLLYSFYRGIRMIGFMKLAARLVPGVILALAIILPWYATHFEALVDFMSRFTYGDAARVHVGESVSDFFDAVGTLPPPIYYVRVLLFTGPSVFFGMPLMLFACLATQQRRTLPKTTTDGPRILVLWVVGSFVILSSISNISHNYAMPILPAIALSIEYLSARLGASRAMRLYAAVPITAICLPYFTQPVGLEWGDTIRRFYPNVAKGAPIDPNWKIDRVISVIERRSEGRPQRIAVLGTHPFFSANNFIFEIRRRGLPMFVTSPVLATDDAVRRYLINCEYVVTKGGVQYPISGSVSLDRLRGFFDAGHFRFEMLPVLTTLPDGAAARVFRHLPYHTRQPRGIMTRAEHERRFPPAGRMLDGRTVIPVRAVFGENIEFLGTYVYRRWGMWFAKCFWHPMTSTDARLNAFMHFLDDQNLIRGQGDHDPGGAGGTVQWNSGDVIAEATTLSDIEEMDGVQTIGVGLWATGPPESRLPASDSTLPVDDYETRVLVPFSSARGSPPPGLSTLKGKEYVSAPVSFSDTLLLASCRLARDQDGRTILQYVWECIGPVLRDYDVFVHITDPEGRIVAQDDHLLLEGGLPTSRLIPGEWIVENRVLKVSAATPQETLDIRLGLKSVVGGPEFLRVVSDECETDWDGGRLLLRASVSIRVE